MKIRRFIVICFVFLALGYARDINAQTRKIRVAIPGYSISQIAFLASTINGYYMNESLELEFIVMSGPTANLAVLSGNVEFNTVPLVGLTTALRGAPLKVVFCTFEKPPHVLYAKPEIQDIQSLRGKRVAVTGLGGVDEVLLREVLARYGIQGERDITILGAGSPATRLSGLANSVVDAAVLVAPFSFKAKEMGFHEIVSFTKQSFVVPSGGIVVREDLIRTDPALVEKFVRGSLKGYLLVRDDRRRAIKTLSQSLKTDESLAAKMYDSARPTMTSNGALSDDSEKKVMELSLRLTGLRESPPYDKFFDFSFLRKARAELESKRWKPGS